jgi:3-oxoadipate enol-lactonase
MVSLNILGAGRPAVPIVLIHAFPLTSEMYSDAAHALLIAQASHPIVLVDLPGFGTAPLEQRWTLASAMNDLHAALATHTIRECIIGGTSMGGYAALAYYNQFAEEVGGMILSNTKAGADNEKAREGREEYAVDVLKRGVDAVIERQFEMLVGETTKRDRPKVVAELRRIIESLQPAAVAAALRAMAVRDDSTALLSDITCPTLVISSDEDVLIPKEATKEIAIHTERAEYEEIVGAGHLTPLEDPKQWASIVARFVAGI